MAVDALIDLQLVLTVDYELELRDIIHRTLRLPHHVWDPRARQFTCKSE